MGLGSAYVYVEPYVLCVTRIEKAPGYLYLDAPGTRVKYITCVKAKKPCDEVPVSARSAARTLAAASLDIAKGLPCRRRGGARAAVSTVFIAAAAAAAVTAMASPGSCAARNVRGLCADLCYIVDNMPFLRGGSDEDSEFVGDEDKEEVDEVDE
ncbi:hypothetical protein PT974_11375 [Cladobotryum mycophilum]|uniref:Uncharacterized protein n=1 Tax=Cladobotryum mycophilum TaxID=491253 RepID=A0ABR0S512_9HYPO